MAPGKAGQLTVAPVEKIIEALAARYPGMTPDEAETAAAQLLLRLAADLNSGKSVGTVVVEPGGSIVVEKFDIIDNDPGGEQ